MDLPDGYLDALSDELAPYGFEFGATTPDEDGGLALRYQADPESFAREFPQAGVEDSYGVHWPPPHLALWLRFDRHGDPYEISFETFDLLADTVLAELTLRYRAPGRALTPEARERLRSYPWPGNVRELRNTLDRAVLFGKGTQIDPAALALPVAPTPTRVYVAPDARFEFEIPDGGLVFEELERAFIVAALRKAGGSPAGAARLLGMTRDTMRYRIEKFGIESGS